MQGVIDLGRRGRRGKPNAMRTASGRLSRARAAVLEDNIEPVETRMRLFGLTKADARDQKAGSVVGRLQLSGELSHAQYDAAVEYQRLHDAYKRALTAPDALRKGTGSGVDVPETDAYAAWCRQVIARHDAAIRAVQAENCILANRGCNLIAALDYVVRRDQALVHLFGDAKLALNVLARHFGLCR